MWDFTGKTVLVTGGARGVGRAIALKFAQHGATVLINCFHSRSEGRETLAELRALGATAHLLWASVAQRAQVERMFGELSELCDGLDFLVNNAAAGALLPLDQLTDEHWQRAWDTNVRGSLWCAQLAAPMMAARGGGAIVNMSSIGADLVPGSYATVGTSKAAVEALTRYLAVEYAPMNIRVNTASCGLVDEGRPVQFFPDSERLLVTVRNATPMGRLATADDLANIVLVLASDATGWVTGQTLLADGGISLASAILSPPADSAAPAIAQAASTASPPRVLPGDGQVTDRAAEPADPAAPAGRGLVAVVGMGAVFPGANSPEEYWQLRLSGEAMFTEPGDRWDVSTTYSPDPDAEDRAYARKSGFIRGLRPRPELVADPLWSAASPTTEYTALWLRHALLQALDGVHRKDEDRVTCHLGHCADGSQHLEESLVAVSLRRRLGGRLAAEVGKQRAAELVGALTESLPLGGSEPWKYLPHVIVQRAVSGILPPRATVIDSACSSSLYALDLAVKDLIAGNADMAVCGGAYAIGPRNPVLFAKLQGLSKTERVRALDREQDGVLFADGAGIIVLKTAERAEADGDRILGYIAGLGTSSDGKGKAIYAPNAKGQELAIARAQRAAGITGDLVQWVAAHATGTPAGDGTEFGVLQRAVGAGSEPCYVTSNKSQIGHTGWAAGVASLIEVLLALKHATIPPQQQFDQPPEAFLDPPTRLVIPTAAHPWPASPARPRIAGVSGFGFGGTNAHVIVADRPLGPPSPSRAAPQSEESIAVVGWSGCLPGLMSDDDVAAWLRGDRPHPPVRFDGEFPLPELSGIRIPPKTLRSMDGCQVMMLECAARLRPALERVWSGSRETTGVIVGHMGPTRTATLYTVRCYLSRLEQHIATRRELRDDPSLQRAFGEFRDEIRGLAGPASEDSLPGGIANTIAARVANYFDFNGVNIAVDTGLNSALSAVEVASAYLRSGELELALVCGINGNSTEELTELLGGNGAPGSSLEPAEGAFMVALMTEADASRHGLTVLGLLRGTRAPDGSPAGTELDCAVVAGQPNYLGGEAARALIRTLAGPPGLTTVRCQDPLSGRIDQLRVEVPQPEESEEPAADAGQRAADAGRPHEEPVVRHVVRLEPRPAPAGAAPAVVTRGTVVLTDAPAIAEQLRTAAGTVMCVTDVDDRVEQLLLGITHPVTDLLVVTSMAGDADLDAVPEHRLRLHDAAFLALRAVHQRLIDAAGAFHVLLLAAVPGGAAHPHSGLFTGLLRAASWELPGCRATSVLLSADDLQDGLARLARDSRAMEPGAVVVYDRSERYVPVAHEERVVAPAQPLLGERPVVVATGGARGVTAEALVAIAERTQAQLWVLGVNDLDDFPDWVYEGTDEEFTARGPALLKDYLATHPDQPPAAAKRRLARMRDARQARANLRRMVAHQGTDRVRYLACDVTDAASVATAIDTIVAASGGIDLLVHGAGVNHSVALARKELADFRLVRDVKVRGYANLKRALRGRAPRFWCNFGSLVGYVGQPGELDYTAGNAFLASAAGYASRAGGARELTLSWPLWKSVGFAADPLVQKFMNREGASGALDTAEGVAHCLAELGGPWDEPEVLYLAAGQRATLEQHPPGRFRAAGSAVAVPVSPTAPDCVPTADPDPRPDASLVVERVISTETDIYLHDHLVSDLPAVPGTFMLEIAAAAAIRLAPGAHVTGFSDTRFEAFLRPATRDGGRATVCRARCRVVAADSAEQRVEVQLVTDVYAPSGVLLRRNRRHCTTTVHLGTRLREPPPWEKPAVVGPVDVLSTDPYIAPNDRLSLSGPFQTNVQLHRHRKGTNATFRIRPEYLSVLPADHVTPALLLDALIRLRTQHVVRDDSAPLLVPTAVERVELFDARNDVRLAADYPEGIGLHYCPAGSDYAGQVLGSDRFFAVAPDGTVLISVRDVTAVELGQVALRFTMDAVPELAGRSPSVLQPAAPPTVS